MNHHSLQTIAGVACILAGIIILLSNKWLADAGVAFQRRIGSPFVGPATFWFERIGGLIVGIGAVGFGILLICGIS